MVDVPAHAFSQCLVKLLGQPWVWLFSLLSDLSNLLQQLTDSIPLFVQFFLQRFSFRRITERALLAIGEFFQILRELFLFLIQILSLVAHVAQILGESLGRILAKLVTQIVQAGFRARAFTERFRQLTVFKSIRGFTDIFSCLI